TFDGGVLVEHAVNLGLDYCTARHGGQQDATQRVAQGMAKATLERLERDLGAGRTDRLNVNVTGGQELIYRNLHGCTYFLALTRSRARQTAFRRCRRTDRSEPGRFCTSRTSSQHPRKPTQREHAGHTVRAPGLQAAGSWPLRKRPRR